MGVSTADPRFEALFNLVSIVSLVFQITGTALIALLSFVVARAVRRRGMAYWAVGWACYAGALGAIMFAFRIGQAGAALLFAYYFLEYAATLSIFAGCRYAATDNPAPRRFWLALVPAALVAAALVGPFPTFFWRFAIHTAIVGGMWAICLVGLWPALRRADAGPGVRIVAVGLVLLSLDYLHHLPTAWYLTATHATLSPYYYTIMSLVDGMFEFVLGFGTVVVIVDKVRAELEQANFRLKLAHDRTQEALHTDALTDASSRYAFTAAFEESIDRRAKRGCIVMADLDGLKRINDTHGHEAGDAAIRAVAQGLRTLVRHGDRVYRWGGDEFVVVLSEIPIELARKRMEALNDAVNRCLDEADAGVGKVTVSWGVSEFGERIGIKMAIAAADAAMYASRSERNKLTRADG
jgi:diguanylate cyclase (GGDEF)-like protein